MGETKTCRKRHISRMQQQKKQQGELTPDTERCNVADENHKPGEEEENGQMHQERPDSRSDHTIKW